jgi:KDO2-lipid IV(A) lauroyltransferase
MKHYIEYIGAIVFIWIIRLFPLGIIYKIGAGIGLFMYYVIPIRRSIALENIKAAFPEKSESERRRICRNAYRHFGMTVLEYVCVGQLPVERVKEMVVFEPSLLLHEEMAQNKGLIGVTGHFSSFELLGIAVGYSGIPIDMVVKPLRNPMTEKLIDEMRKSTGLGVIKVKEGFLKIMRSIHKKRLVALVADQDAGQDGIPVKFFGIDSSTPAGPGILAVRTGARMIAGFIVREQPGKYRAYIHSIPYERMCNPGDNTVIAITQYYTALLESYIRRYPEQYFWMHKRWKSAGLYRK